MIFAGKMNPNNNCNDHWQLRFLPVQSLLMIHPFFWLLFHIYHVLEQFPARGPEHCRVDMAAESRVIMNR